MSRDGNEISALMGWLGAIAYTFQIFFDFGGYSDMAIGLGRMLDMRNFEYYAGEKLDAYEYIRQVNPDYVIVLYSGVENENGRYDFH